MKKISIIFLIVLLLFVSLMFVGCAHEHEFGEWKTVTEATCLIAGVQERTCECGEKETQEIAAKGHTESDWKTVAKATCTTTGAKKKVCTVCNATIDSDIIAKVDHTPGSEATCTTAQTCTACKKVLVTALGHTPGDEATCTTAQTCTVCNAELVAALGHNYLVSGLENDGVAGSNITYSCQNCDSSYDQLIEEISVSVQFDGMSSATINGYGSYTNYYVVTATGGYGDYKYKYEVFSDSNSTVPMSHLTRDLSSESEYAISYRGYMGAISGYVLQVTVIDEAGNTAVCRYTI